MEEYFTYKTISTEKFQKYKEVTYLESFINLYG